MAIIGGGTMPSIFGGPKLNKFSAFLLGDCLGFDLLLSVRLLFSSLLLSSF